MNVLRAALPACQPQEASPANTFTAAELEELRQALPHLHEKLGDAVVQLTQDNNKVDITTWKTTGENDEEEEAVSADWHDAPRITSDLVTQSFRQQVRLGMFTGATNGVCPGFLQCNMVVLPQGPLAFDFLLFCQRNKKACPLIEVCSGADAPFPTGVAKGADLRTDVPKYAIYRDGKLEKEVTDVTEYWPEDAVSFLIGCSFSYDGALLEADIPLRSAEQGKNVPMYRTNLKCRPAGSLTGNMVVSMKPISGMSIAKEVEITNSYPHAHGGPVCVGGDGRSIGIKDLSKPEWGDAVDLQPGEIPVFHACGVTPQAVLMDSKVDFAITHSAGHMFVTDLPSDYAF